MRRLIRIGLLAVLAATVCAMLPRDANTLKYVEFPKYHPQQTQIAPSTRGGPADIILTNGQIYTLDPAHPWASSIAMRGETIVGITYSAPPSDASPAPSSAQPHANGDELKNFRGRNTRVIDLHGQFAMPGFNDSHVHLAEDAYAKNNVNLVATSSLSDFEQRIRVTLSFYKPGEWIVGQGWDPHAVAAQSISDPRGFRFGLHGESDFLRAD